MTPLETLTARAYDLAWELVAMVENFETPSRVAKDLAADFLTAYADTYGDENARARAEKIKQTQP